MSTSKPVFGEAVSLAVRRSALALAVLATVVIVRSAIEAPRTGDSSARDDDRPKAAAKPPAGEPRVVELNRDAQSKGGIETTEPASEAFQDEVRAYGIVLPLGRLVALYNSSLTDSVQLQAAQAKQAESRAADARAQTLLKAFPSAQAQAETAAATAEIDTAGTAMAKARIEALRNDAVLEWGPKLGDAIVARAPLAADLVAGRARLVQLTVQPGMMVAPPRRLSFALGTAAPVEGTLVSEAAESDPKVQNIGYLYSVPIAPGLLPGASVIARLPKSAARPGLDIPSSAVVWQAGKPWMYLRTAPNRFERRPIDEAAAPTADGGYVVPAKSLGADEDKAIVTAGAQVLLSQEMRARIPSDEDNN